MNKIVTLTLVIAATFPTGCATTPEAKLNQAYKRAAKTPFSQLPALYVKLEQEDKITPDIRKAWTEDWAVNNKKQQEEIAAYQREQQLLAEQRRRWWASLTPAQRFDLEMRERELQQQQSAIAWQAEQQRQANIQAAFQNVSNTLQRQQEVNAYNARTRALQQPVNVNVNGTVNHNINGRINVYGY